MVTLTEYYPCWLIHERVRRFRFPCSNTINYQNITAGGRDRSMSLFCWIDEVCNSDSVHSIISGSCLREIPSLYKKITNFSRCAAYFFCCRIMTIQFLKGAIVQKLTPSSLSRVQLCQTHLWRFLHSPPARNCWRVRIPDVHAKGSLIVHRMQNLKMHLMRINLANFGFTVLSKLEKNSGIKYHSLFYIR